MHKHHSHQMPADVFPIDLNADVTVLIETPASLESVTKAPASVPQQWTL